jgi:predicted GIY-YIG superfamily endonuclease
MMRRYSVYILQSLVDPSRHYCGVRSNVEERIAVHNAGGSAHTAKYRPWRLSVTVIFDDPLRATRFEKYLKSGSGRAFCRRHFDPALSDGGVRQGSTPKHQAQD